MTGSIGLVIALAACSGAADNADTPNADSVPRTTSTTAPPETSTTVPQPTTTTSMPLYSFDGSVPPPPLINTGDDFDAIYRSLDAYSTWLYSHNPEGEIGAIIPIGTDYYATYADDLGALRAQDLRLYDLTESVARVELVDRAAMVATLRVTISAGERTLINSSGAIVDTAQTPESDYIALLVTDPSGIWRMASLTPADNDRLEIEL